MRKLTTYLRPSILDQFAAGKGRMTCVNCKLCAHTDRDVIIGLWHQISSLGYVASDLSSIVQEASRRQLLVL